MPIWLFQIILVVHFDFHCPPHPWCIKRDDDDDDDDARGFALGQPHVQSTDHKNTSILSCFQFSPAAFQSPSTDKKAFTKCEQYRKKVTESYTLLFYIQQLN